MATVLNHNVSKPPQLSPEQYTAIVSFYQRNHIRWLALFGSFLRDDFRPDSDIDVLVEFETEYTPGLALIRMQDELSHLFDDRQIDLVTKKFLNARIRDRVLAESYTLYDKR